MKEIGQYFKERFDQFEPNPPSDFWAKIQNDKSLKRFNKMQSFKRFFKFGFTPAAVVVIAIVLWVSNTQKESTQNQAAVNTPQPTTIVTKQVSNSVPQQEQTLKTDIVPQESTPTKKNSDKLAVNKVEPNTELTKSNVEPIQSQNLIKSNPISNKVSPSSTNNSVPVNNTPKESPKTNTKVSSNNQSEANPSLNKTSIEEEPVLENSIDNTNNNEPEAGIDKLMIPNSFTPNGDGINDQFLVKAMWSVQEFEIIIYERSGNVVFKTNDIGMGWDGTHLGKEIHSGVYVYLVTYKDSIGNKQKTKGTLNLIR
jgi:gliding motility-associated-like protein